MGLEIAGAGGVGAGGAVVRDGLVGGGGGRERLLGGGGAGRFAREETVGVGVGASFVILAMFARVELGGGGGGERVSCDGGRR